VKYRRHRASIVCLWRMDTVPRTGTRTSRWFTIALSRSMAVAGSWSRWCSVALVVPPFLCTIIVKSRDGAGVDQQWESGGDRGFTAEAYRKREPIPNKIGEVSFQRSL